MQPVAWFNIPTDNLERATNFYNKVFGWKIQALSKEKNEVMDFHTVLTAESDENFNPLSSGAINGCIVKREMGIPHATILIQVENLESSVKAAIAAGGTVVMEKTDITQARGYLVLIKDTENNIIELFQSY